MKIVLWLGAGIVFFNSCASYIHVSQEKDYSLYQKKKHIEVLYIETGLLDTIFFTEQYPGMMQDGMVHGIRQTALEHFYPDSVIFSNEKNQSVMQYVIKSGVRYDVLNENNRTYLYNVTETVQIPFSDINQMYLKISRPYVTNLFLVAISGASVGLALWIISGMSEVIDVY